MLSIVRSGQVRSDEDQGKSGPIRSDQVISRLGQGQSYNVKIINMSGQDHVRSDHVKPSVLRLRPSQVISGQVRSNQVNVMSRLVQFSSGSCQDMSGQIEIRNRSGQVQVTSCQVS